MQRSPSIYQLDQASTPIVKINLLSLDDAGKEMLNALLTQHCHRNYLPHISSVNSTPIYYKINYKNTKISVQLSHSLSKKIRQHKPGKTIRDGEYRYEIHSHQLLGKGNQGSVAAMIATICLNPLRIKLKNTRIVKLVPEDSSTNANMSLQLNSTTKIHYAIHERNMLNLIKDSEGKTDNSIYGQKELLLDIFTKMYILPMRRFPGGDLLNFLRMPAFNQLNFENRIQIFRSILLNLNMLHKNNIAHRDIKLENTIIDPATLYLRIIDFGLARDLRITTQGGTSPGSPVYASPEAWGWQSIEQPADIFAAGRIFAFLLGNLSVACPYYLQKNNGELKKMCTTPHLPPKNDLFSKLEYPCTTDIELQQLISDLMYNLFKAMQMVDPKQRATINDCLTALDQIMFCKIFSDLKISNTDRSSISSIQENGYRP